MDSTAARSAASDRSQISSEPTRLSGRVGELDVHVFEAEIAVDAQDELADPAALGGDLIRGTEDVGVVLGERAHPQEPVQGARRLEPVHLAELAHAKRQVLVARDAVVEDLEAPRAVHRLESEHPIVPGLGGVHVLGERLPVPRRLPQRSVHDVRGVDLPVAGLVLPGAHVVDEALEQGPAVGVPEHRPRRLFLEVEQVHLASEPAVVPPLRFLDPPQMRAQRLRVRPRGAVDPLQHGVARVPAPVGPRHRGELEGRAEPSGGGKVRPAAQIDEPSLAIHRDRVALGDALDDLRLVRLADAAEEPRRLGAIPRLASHGLVAGHDLPHSFLDSLEVVGGERLVAGEVVVEAVLDGGPDGDLRLGMKLLDRLGEDVRRVVAQEVEPVGLGSGDDGGAGIRLDDGGEIAQLPVQPHGDRVAGKPLADGLGKLEPGHRPVELADGPVGKRDVRHD